MTWTRSDHLSRLLKDGPFDVVVVGGGIIGAGTALDLAQRGLSVAVVEQNDFAQGTSSRSTKLFHGGIRYLPQFHFALVAEGLSEQKVLAEVVDFLYRPLEFVVPLYRQFGLADAPRWLARGWRAPLALRAGVTLYDLLGGFGRPGARHRSLSVAEVKDLAPALRGEGLKGGFAYHDAQTDDARLVITVLKTAVGLYGAVAVNRVEARSVRGVGDGFEVDVTDGSNEFVVKTRTVLAATGAFDPPELAGGGKPLRMVVSRGTHLVIDPTDLPTGNRAVVLPETEDGRVLFIIPWLGRALVGTTDMTHHGDTTYPTPLPEDVDYLMRHLRMFLDVAEFEPISSFAGLRALADYRAATTAEASRDHEFAEVTPGYVQVAGGKLTTYRRISRQAADRLAKHLGVTQRSASHRLPMVGTGQSGAAESRRRLTEASFPPPVIEAAVAAYGGDAAVIAGLGQADRRLTAILSDGETSLASVAYAARHEAVSRISDITLRRCHLSWFTKDHGRVDAPAIADVLATELGWSESEIDRQLRLFEAELIAEGL